MENIKQEFKYLLAGFIIVELVFIIIISVVGMNSFSNDNVSFIPSNSSVVNVSNLSSSFSNQELYTINRTLYSLMLKNSSNKQLLKSDVVATVDEGSDKSVYFEDLGFTIYSANLSAEQLGQAYKLYYGYPDDDSSVQSFISLYCKKAPVEPCVSDSNTDEIDIIHQFLPKVWFDRFSVFFNDNEPMKINIVPALSTKEDGGTREASYISDVKNAVSELGSNPDYFTYYVVNNSDLTYIIDD